MQDATTLTPQPEVDVDLSELNYRQELKLRSVPFRGWSEEKLKYQRLPICGHKLVAHREPRHRNCQMCWFTYFRVNGSVTQTADEVFSQFGVSGLKQIKGESFTKNYLAFMSTLAQWKAAAGSVETPTSEVTPST